MNASTKRLKAAEAEYAAAREEHAFQNACRYSAVDVLEEVRNAVGALVIDKELPRAEHTVKLQDVFDMILALQKEVRMTREWVSPATRYAAGRKAAE